ncbi:hypothetical protein [Pendulispora albinea]|uniref:Uncharacterized protein n=1 Tax=Pendulispora albinea TaxID=2741071 RepID=A0ABZ2M0G5_9BACT
MDGSVRYSGWSVTVPVLASLPAAAYIGVYCAQFPPLDPSFANGVGVILFVVLTLPVARLALRARRGPQPGEELSPGRAFKSALPLFLVIFGFPVWNTLTNLRPVREWSISSIVGATCAMALAYAWPIFTAARAIVTRAVSALDDSLLASTVALSATALFVRFSSESQHYHVSSLPLGAAVQVLALACGAVALAVSLRRWRWAAAVFRSAGEGWRVVDFQSTVHATVPPLDVAEDASMGDGVVVRRLASSEAPYRSHEHVHPVARTWRDTARALRPMVRRCVKAAVAFGAIAIATPLIVSRVPAVVHRAEEDTQYVAPSGRLGFPSQCRNREPVYFVPLGDQYALDVPGLARRYTEAYGVPFLVGRGRELPRAAYDEKRKQWAAEVILDDLKRHSTEIAPENAFIVGLTSHDLFLSEEDWRFVFGARDPPNRAVVSTARLGLGTPAGFSWAAVADYRLRKMVTRNLGFLYCDLESSANPASILFHRNVSVFDLDRMDESIW